LEVEPKKTVKERHQQLLEAMATQEPQEEPAAAASSAAAPPHATAGSDGAGAAAEAGPLTEEDAEDEEGLPQAYDSSQIAVDRALMDEVLGALGSEDKIYWQTVLARD
jgi:hypothetical protein